VLLPIAVAAILVIVQDSLAVAFSLAGIAGLLRFRNALDDTRDAMYVVIAIAVGLGAGVGTLEASAALSGVYNLAVVAESTAPAGKREGMLRVHAADDIPTRRLIEEGPEQPRQAHRPRRSVAGAARATRSPAHGVHSEQAAGERHSRNGVMRAAFCPTVGVLTGGPLTTSKPACG